MTEAHLDNDTILVRVPGSRAKRMALTLENCFALRQEHGPQLRVATPLASWAKAEIDRRMDGLEVFRKMTDALPLRDHQVIMREHLLTNPRAALFVNMGAGKTLATLSAITPQHLPVLVVAPKRVAEKVWPVEITRWRPDLTYALAAGTAAKRRAALASGADIVVISRDNLKDVAKTGPWTTLVLDESSSFKNRSTNRWKLARPAAMKASYVWELTGTPNPNGYLDLWAPTFLLDAGDRLGTTLGGYRGRYFTPGLTLPNGVVADWRLRKGSADSINAKLADICLSIEVEGTPFVYNQVTLGMPSEIKTVYAQMAQELVAEVDDEVYTSANAAVLSGKLSQLTAGFMYTDEKDGTYTWLHNAKLDALEEIAEGTGDNLLVYYRFKAEAEQIKRRFPQAVDIDAKGAYDAWNRGEIRMLLAHPASAGHGLNLQHGGHTVVWTSVDWNLEYWLQANARLGRGEAHPVTVHTIEVEGTVDPFIREALDSKDMTQQHLLDYLKAGAR